MLYSTSFRDCSRSCLTCLFISTFTMQMSEDVQILKSKWNKKYTLLNSHLVSAHTCFLCVSFFHAIALSTADKAAPLLLLWMSPCWCWRRSTVNASSKRTSKYYNKINYTAVVSAAVHVDTTAVYMSTREYNEGTEGKKDLWSACSPHNSFHTLQWMPFVSYCQNSVSLL